MFCKFIFLIDRDLYWCAKNCKLGDLLPVVPAEEEEGMEIKEGLVGKGMA